jgi:hypothetical protein
LIEETRCRIHTYSFLYQGGDSTCQARSAAVPRHDMMRDDLTACQRLMDEATGGDS